VGDSRRDEELGFFEGKSLEQLCFGLYQLALNFEGGVSLYVESRLTLRERGGEEFEFSQPYAGAGRLLGLLGSEVVRARGEADGGLALEFSNECALFVSMKDSGYESYQIRDGTSEIIA
jgi:hypothetical protein